MRPSLVIVLAVILGVGGATAVQAQEKSSSILDRVFSTVVDDDDAESNSTRSRGQRARGSDREVNGPRGRTGRTDQDRRGSSRTDDDSRGSSRAESDSRASRRADDAARGRGSARTDDRARGRDHSRSDEHVYERDADENRGRRSDRGYDDDGWEDAGRRDRGQGPMFCRTGEGHPVFGREWCRDKGFGRERIDDYWEERRAPDVRFPIPQRRSSRTMDGGVLGDILGVNVLGSLQRLARQHGFGPISGRWNGDSELRIFAGSTPLARMVDRNADYRADVVYLRR